jgi:formylglycine-generating enzyme required for sulfatase activity
MCLEHECWHVEVKKEFSFGFFPDAHAVNSKTLLYMLIQRAGTGTLPPTGFTVPPFELLSSQWNNPSVSPRPISTSVVMGPATITLGHDDSEADDDDSEVEPDHEYGWDNESPARSVYVEKVRVEWWPVSNGEFLVFWKDGKNGVEMPCSWIKEDDGDVMVIFLSLSTGSRQQKSNRVHRCEHSMVPSRWKSLSIGPYSLHMTAYHCTRNSKADDYPANPS